MGMLTSSYDLQYLRSWGSSVAADGSLQPFQEAKGTGAAQNLFCTRSAERGAPRRYCGRPSPLFRATPTCPCCLEGLQLTIQLLSRPWPVTSSCHLLFPLTGSLQPNTLLVSTHENVLESLTRHPVLA